MIRPEPPVDFRALFDSAPELFLTVCAAHDYPIAAASDRYLQATMTRRDEIVGRPFFEIFPSNPADPANTSREQLHAALDRVRGGGEGEVLPELKYDIRRPAHEGGTFEERYWQTSVTPARNNKGEVEWILCRTEDVTARVRSEREMEDARSRMEATLGSADVGTWIWDVASNRVTADRNLARLFGVDAQSAEGGPLEHYTQHIHEDDRARVASAIEEAMHEGRRFDTEYRIRQPDQSIRWVAARGWAERDADDVVRRFPGVVIDITDRKRAEEDALRHSRQLKELAGISTRLNAAHDVTSVLGIVTEEARILVGAQRAVTSLMPAQPLEQPVTVVSQLENARSAVGSFRSVAETPALLSLAERLHAPLLVTRDEAARSPDLHDPAAAELGLRDAVVSWLAAPLVGRSTRRLGVIHLANKAESDFTAHDAALLAQLAQIAAVAIENARLYEELREKDQRKDEFLAMLAHELRNPLAAIRNAVALGSDQEAKAEEIEWSMEVINRQMRQLSRLIDDLLDVSRITQGKVQLRREPIDAARVLQSAVDAVQGLMEEREHELTVSFRPGTLHVEADPTRLEQIIVNLLTNAARYTEKGGEISLRAKLEDGQVVVRIKDNGIGIPPEKLPLMFELFAQGDRTLARSEGGLGIGLTIVRSLAELHGGSVEAHSEGLGQGSEFILRLPAISNARGSESTLARPDKKASAAGRNPPRPAPTRRRVLIVDDNADSAHGTAKILRRQGHDVQIVFDGPGALAAAQEYQPGYVLLDIGLPGMDGYEVAQRLRADETLRDATLIAVSGYGQDSDRRRSREAGFDSHLVKPVDPEELLALLN
jgi:PAS domain S-box-containing protein